MIVFLTINRIKQDNEILELFTAYPKSSLLYDQHRAINFVLWYLRGKHSIANIIEIKDIKFNKDSVLYKYNYQPINVPLHQIIPIQYFPVLGEKKCRLCCYERVINNKSFCLMRGVANKPKSYYKCLYWTETFQTLRHSHALHHTRRSKEDASVDRRISRDISGRRKLKFSDRTNNDYTICSILRQTYLRNDL